MKRPKRIKSEHYNYHQCDDYIAHKLGVKNLRDMLGKFNSDKSYEETKDIEYKDFWHFICERCGIHNGCFFHMPEPYKGCGWEP